MEAYLRGGRSVANGAIHGAFAGVVGGSITSFAQQATTGTSITNNQSFKRSQNSMDNSLDGCTTSNNNNERGNGYSTRRFLRTPNGGVSIQIQERYSNGGRGFSSFITLSAEGYIDILNHILCYPHPI